MKNLVEIKDGKAFTTSRKIAEKFGKRHNHVLDKIRIEMSFCDSVTLPNFRLMNEISSLPTNGDEYYELTEDGYSFVVMSFTGEKARKFKWDYIAEFNRMRSVIEQSVSEKLIVAETKSAWAMGELELVMARQPNHKHSLACRLGLKAHEVGQYFKYLVGIGELEAKTETITRTTYHPTERSKHVTGALGKTLLFDDSVKIAFPENTDWTK